MDNDNDSFVRMLAVRTCYLLNLDSWKSWRVTMFPDKLAN